MTVTAERDKIRHAYEQLKGQLELLRRRIFLAKAERIDTQQLEIEFAETKARLDSNRCVRRRLPTGGSLGSRCRA